MGPCTVIVATCGRIERLSRALDAIGRAIRTAGGEGSAIVADNGPGWPAEPAVANFARRSGVAAQCLKTPPRHKPKALNAAIAAARADWLAFTDDDTIPADDWLARGAEFAARTGLRAFGGRVEPAWLNVKPPRWLTPGRSGRAPGYGAVVGYNPLPASGTLGPDDTVPFGANLFVRREVFARYGGYDEALWDLCGNHALGVEDGEFGMRIRAAGEPVGYCREAVVTHPVYADRCTLRNHARLAYHYGWREPILFPNPARPWLEPYRLRLIAARLARLAADWLRGDPAGAADDWVEAARQIGGIACRWSAAYRMAMRRLAA